ncbi:hypothetical protein [Streptomyces sp. NPDC048057]|uniref:hypothetical protein n=1 Tax=Streptomyces sp. NPDC048057 TaxID=3155628 RepID=UPI0033D2A043
MGKTRAALSFDDRADRLLRAQARQRREDHQLDHDERRPGKPALSADEFWGSAHDPQEGA